MRGDTPQNEYRLSPPSTGSTAPVMYLATGDAKNTANDASSSGSP